MIQRPQLLGLERPQLLGLGHTSRSPTPCLGLLLGNKRWAELLKKHQTIYLCDGQPAAERTACSGRARFWLSGLKIRKTLNNQVQEITLIQHLVQYLCCRRWVFVTISIWIHCFLGHKTSCTKDPFNISVEPCIPGHTNPFMGAFMKQSYHNFCAQRQHSSGFSLEYGPIFNKDGSLRLLWSHCNAGFCHIAWIQWPVRSGSKFWGKEASKFFSDLSAKCDTWNILLVMICFLAGKPKWFSHCPVKLSSRNSQEISARRNNQTHTKTKRKKHST